MILFCVHLEARRLGLKGCDPSEVPAWRAVFKDAHLLIPVVVLVILLMIHRSPHFAAFWAIVTLLAVSWLKKETRIGPRKLWDIAANAGRNMAIVALACAGAGMFVACLTVTGLVVALSTIITSLAHGNLLLAACC